jgi:hypothetical protein
MVTVKSESLHGLSQVVEGIKAGCVRLRFMRQRVRPRVTESLLYSSEDRAAML